MTLKVYIDVVPLGNVEEAYPLHEIAIHNVGETGNGKHEYTFEVDDRVAQETVVHDREEGPLELVRAVLATEWMKLNFPEYVKEPQLPLYGNFA